MLCVCVCVCVCTYSCVLIEISQRIHVHTKERAMGNCYYLWVVGMWGREHFTLHFAICILFTYIFFIIICYFKKNNPSNTVCEHRSFYFTCHCIIGILFIIMLL